MSISFRSRQKDGLIMCHFHVLWSVALILTACGTVEEPIVPNTDAMQEVLSDADIPSIACHDWGSPYWDELFIEVTSGPTVGLDAVVLTHLCDGKDYYGQRLEFLNNSSGASADADFASTIGAPDSSPEQCTGHYATMAAGDIVGIKIWDMHPGDTLQAVVVEPNGTCNAAEMTNHLRLSISSLGPDYAVFVGEGPTVTLPNRNGSGWVVP